MITAEAPSRRTFARPRSLAEVESCARIDGHGIDLPLREFLDEFYVEDRADVRVQMLAREPSLTGIDRHDAYLAAVAEHLARRYRLAVPGWAGKSNRFLKRPYFPSGLESLKAILIVESPVAFRKRLIFVDKDPLYRPRRDVRGIGERP